MRLLSCLCSMCFVLSCSDSHDEEAFATFQECYDDHHEVEAFDIITSIKICCIDHPIGADDINVVCGETQQACEDYVDAQLSNTDITLTDIETACSEYLIERNQ